MILFMANSSTAEAKQKKNKSAPVLLRGFKDILPEESAYWHKFYTLASELLASYGFQEINTPILEATSLFRRSLGETTDSVEKEMFTFTDRSRDSVTLRPEMTAGICRAYIEHGMFNRPQPVKLWSWGPLFRYDRPQAGRFRQFNQLDIEIIGNDREVVDAEVIFISHLLCQAVGVDVNVQINSLGNTESRKEYIKILKDYYRSKRRILCEDCRMRITKNVLRLLDCKQPECHSLLAGAPQLLDHLDDDSKKHFVKVLEYLDESEVPYVLNPYIVRGLDYYNYTTFELWPVETIVPGENDASAPNAIGGGGRYDGLMEQIGGRPTPAVGMAFGLERLLDLVKKTNPDFLVSQKPDIFLAQLGMEAAKHIFCLFEKLRSSGLRVVANFSKEGLKQQLEIANKLGVTYTVILGQKELLDGTIIIRDMENGIQEVVDLNKVCEELKKRLLKK
ncbi:MAG: histidine--tRNA ligase, partial [Candidatus Komeilibacteria bacterium]|nr:histidine--tRNA ligase [Candidatus Komeilibacteria bacterium]